MISPPRSVLFVCLGNICRSPTGEAVLKKLADARGLSDQIRIDSAGTGSWHVGARADPRMRGAGAQRGYKLDSIGRQFTVEDFESFDLILAMDFENFNNLSVLDPSGAHADKLKLFCDFIPDSHIRDVPDPYYGGPDGFEKVIDLIEEGCHNILDHMVNGTT